MHIARELAQWQQWHDWVTVAATVAFAITGVLAISEDREIDLLGVLVFGVITGIGGGTIRDVILGVPPSWSREQWPVAVAGGAAFVAFYARRRIKGKWVEVVLIYLDGLGAAMFAIQATFTVWVRDFARPTGPIILGLLTAIGGGLLRDLLAGRPTLLVRSELYATPVLFGTVAGTIVLSVAPEAWGYASPLCIAGTFAFRATAIHWNLSFPKWARTGGDDAG